MCYTGKGRFETSMGDCMVRNSTEFKESLNIDACTVCFGYDFNVIEAVESGEIKSEDFYTEEELENLSKLAYQKNLIRGY